MQSALVFVFVPPPPPPPPPPPARNYCPTPATPTANFLVTTTQTPSRLATLFSLSSANPNPRHSYFSCGCRPRHRYVLYCSSLNKLDSAPDLDGVDDDVDPKIDVDMDTDDENEDVLSTTKSIIKTEIEKTGTNCRRIQSEILIEAPLNTVWNLLTDYERLADFIPGLAVCRLLHKTHNYARLFQIGQQNLAFGLKFNAQGIVDCYETPLESLPNFGLKRDIEFNMVEGDFEIFQGKWSLQQQLSASTDQQEMHTSLSYLVDVKPKLWLPVRLVEGRLCKEINTNLACIRQQALEITHNNTL